MLIAPSALLPTYRRAFRSLPLLAGLALVPALAQAEPDGGFAPVWPTHGVITTYFGERSPLLSRGHPGIDIAAPKGTPVAAADDGEVLKASWSGDGYGSLIIIAHPSGFETWYAHLSQIGVEPGAGVHKGDQIGLMGSTGFSTGSHLHFEVHEDGQLCDPLAFLSETQLATGETW